MKTESNETVGRVCLAPVANSTELDRLRAELDATQREVEQRNQVIKRAEAELDATKEALRLSDAKMCAFKAELDRAKAANQALRDGRKHDYHCDKPMHGKPCTCGLDATLSTTCGTDYIARDKVVPIVEALEKYGHHSDGCCYWNPIGDGKCTCEISAALATARELGIGGER